MRPQSIDLKKASDSLASIRLDRFHTALHLPDRKFPRESCDMTAINKRLATPARTGCGSIHGLPEECLSFTISLTSPRDACRSALVSKIFKSAADSDGAWDKFLPSDSESIVKRSPSAPSLLTLSKKRLYLHLCNCPVLIDDGNMSFQLERHSGGKCYMLGARALSVTRGDRPQRWRLASSPESRFSEVAEIKLRSCIEVRGEISPKILSSRTTYTAYLVYKITKPGDGFRQRPVELRVSEGSGEPRIYRVFLEPAANVQQFVQLRQDNWMEVKMGDFFNEHGDDGPVSCSARIDNTARDSLLIEGIELRPKVSR